MIIFRRNKQGGEVPLPVKASIAFMICNFLQRGISTLTTPIFTRLLDTEQYGFYSIFNSWIDIVSVFTTLRLGGGVFTQALVKYDKDRNKYASSTAGLGTAISLIALFVYLIFRSFFNSLMDTNTFLMVCIIVASWASLMFELWSSEKVVDYDYKPLVVLTIITSMAKPLMGIVAILLTPFNLHAYARILSLVLVEVAAYSWIIFFFLRRNKTFYSKKMWRYSLSLNVPLIPHYLTRTVLNQCDRIMIKSMVGYSSAGIYSLAYNLAWMLSLFSNAILNSFNPWIYKRIKNSEFKRLRNTSYAILILVAILGLGLIAFAPEIVKIFAPTDYYDAIWVIPPVTASVFFLFMYSLFADFEFYFEKTKIMSVVSAIGGVLNVVLNFFCIKAFGYIAAGYTTLICYITFALAHYFATRKIQKEYLNNEKVYNPWIILAISATFLVLSFAMMITYKMIVIRYSIIVLSLFVLIIKRNMIIKVIKTIRSKN